jgi:hypothetical protein
MTTAGDSPPFQVWRTRPWRDNGQAYPPRHLAVPWPRPGASNGAARWSGHARDVARKAGEAKCLIPPTSPETPPARPAGAAGSGV